MAKKKPGKKSPKKPPRTWQVAEPLSELPDPHVLDEVMRDFLGQMAGSNAPGTPQGQAEEIMFQALAITDKRKRASLARKALEISPDCTDAYILLGELAKTRKEALEFYRQGVEAGERSLGPDYFKSQTGQFWRLLETRPYMRARLSLADVLWTLGHRDEAIAHLQAILQLNPGDNQGVRYVLAGWLLNMDRFDELACLLDEFDEATAAWAYTKALLAFRRDGDVPTSRKQLKAAQQVNKYVPDYLLGKKPMPREQPAFYGLGDANEAILYTGSAMGGWKSTPGALAWLRAAVPKSKGPKSRQSKPQGPLPLVQKQLLRLPQEFDVWQADFRQLRARTESGGELVHPWVVIVTSRSDDLILSQSLVESAPTADLLWDQLAAAMQAPIVGDAHRPTALQVHAGEAWEVLMPALKAIGIEVEVLPTLDQMDVVFEELESALAGDQPPSLLDMPGVTPEMANGFYQAAAEFYRSAPWRKLGYESAIRVECDRLESGPRYAVVMGQSGLTFGLAIYDDLKVLKKLWSGRMSDDENARETVALSVTYDDDSGITDGDLKAIEDYEWEIVSPEAYPSIFRKERGLSMRPPLGWELEFMQACLRAIPEFVARHPTDNLTKYDTTIRVTSGELRLTLSWADA
ncbi:hypothetical protein V5E97_28165 [Singulisphaera sp. Ch08]|uniref:Tetratricopeptide repeat protein n=1 Tax=Singulisphaera sp. Ch08 TaxID=3120278 RepID=A0AAU7C9Q0_9BACT